MQAREVQCERPLVNTVCVCNDTVSVKYLEGAQFSTTETTARSFHNIDKRSSAYFVRIYLCIQKARANQIIITFAFSLVGIPNDAFINK